MKLERRFDWLNRESIYKRVDENELERAPGGLVRFHAVRATDGNVFLGAGFETSVAAMCDNDFWKLAPNAKKPDKSIVVAATIPLPESDDVSVKALSKEGSRIRKAKGD